MRSEPDTNLCHDHQIGRRKLKDMIDHDASLTQTQVELQILLTTNVKDVQMDRQTGASLQGFYENTLFSCRGFA